MFHTHVHAHVHVNLYTFMMHTYMYMYICVYCVYTPTAAMPPDSEQYYGFNQFAIQLNGFEQGMRQKLPQTDSRFRPDQRSAVREELSNLAGIGTHTSIRMSATCTPTKICTYTCIYV